MEPSPEEIKSDAAPGANGEAALTVVYGAAAAPRKVKDRLPLEALAILGVCLIIYLANRTTISVGDSVPNTLFGLNLLENFRLDFDNFRGSYLAPSTAHWFIENHSGHLNSAYPLGPSIVSFPICVVFWAFLRLSHVPVILTSQAFEPYRLTFEHIAACIIAALGVMMFYLVSRLRFGRKTSLITTGVFAFATNTWVTSSQGLWQHGSSNLVLLGATYSLLRATRESAAKQRDIRLLVAGLLCGLLPLIRPSDAIFALATSIYCVLVFRFESICFLLGLFTCLPGFLYNLFFFGNVLGGYQSLFSPDVFSPSLFKTSFWGSLFSPSRGLFIYSPVLIFSFVGLGLMLKRGKRPNLDEQLILALTAASGIVCSLYFFYLTWWAGHSFGPRFMTEGLPMLVFLMNYFVDVCFATAAPPAASPSPSPSLSLSLSAAASASSTAPVVSRTSTTFRRLPIVKSIFLVLLSYSIVVQVVGAFGIGGKYWNLIPLNVDNYQWRLWSFQDTQIERHWHALMHRLHPGWLSKMFRAGSTSPASTSSFSGKILSLADEGGLLLPNPLIVSAGAKKALKMQVQNTNGLEWIGYESGRDHTETYTYVQITFLDKRGKKSSAGGKLYVADSIGTEGTSWSIGEVSFPSQPGEYLMLGRMRCDALTEKQNSSELRAFEVRVVAK